MGNDGSKVTGSALRAPIDGVGLVVGDGIVRWEAQGLREIRSSEVTGIVADI